jgi:hypothetical protein
MARAGRDHCRGRSALCTGRCERAAPRPRWRPGRTQSGLRALFVALIAGMVWGEKVSTKRKFGLSAILTGAFVIIGWRTEAWSTSGAYGHALSLSAAFMWACFTVIMRRAKLDPLHAAALVSTGSLVIYIPLYLAMYGNPTGADTAPRHHSSSDVPGRCRDHRFPSSLWPCDCDYWALRVALLLELWCRRCRRSLQYLSSGSGQATQIG